LWVADDKVRGVDTAMGLRFRADRVVLATGTFLGGRIHVGLDTSPGGRAGDAPSNRLAERLRKLPLRVGRLKTGTPPRIDGRSVDFSAMEVQPSAEPRPTLSFLTSVDDHPRQMPCHITHTNPATHEIIRAALDRSPMFSGAIEGVGPRYCPSIEDKVVRFRERQSHQVFVEPEGLDTPELYPNGISTSLPFDVQLRAVRSIRGFEQARLTRPGYAIEYDFFDPRDLAPSLETKVIEGLYFAGQINGTTGYEEAAAQGLLAGINAGRAAAGKPPWCPARHEAYIGVLVDDLINLGASEPYRMFTSRAEYRLRLRQDNADFRLTPVGRELGVVGDARWQVFTDRRERIARLRHELHEQRVHPGSDLALALERRSGEALAKDATLLDLLKRPTITAASLLGAGVSADEAALAQVEIEAKYAGYIRRQDEEIEQSREDDNAPLPSDFDYASVAGLSNEVRERLRERLPATVAQASRVPGITPAALSLLRVYSRRHAEADNTADDQAQRA
ncbi:MAG: tRNA uridine-5-carboxymethylaminomethyl(34) synthesis enzyme MnmG, partial [Gammaproteobacteria bacterium]|nr:tRNA uridine-5-carboxymethylaminomethyl(34) synthesis enzyme MnmG [Gammaproteobacteria bacterium]